jgi:hypothetical protein
MAAMEDTQTTANASTALEDMEKMTVGDKDVAEEQQSETTPTDGTSSTSSSSALQDNIARKGKNSYYFAHAHKANGPKWDGKAEPKLLMKQSLSREELMQEKKTPSFAYHKSNITSYAFLNEEKVVKLYITMEQVGEKCTEEDIQLDWDESSLSLVVKNFKEDEDQCLSFGKLTAKIVDAKYKLKKDKIILTLKKEKEGVEWHTINDKGAPDHELV